MSILTAASAAVGARWKSYTPLLEYMGGGRVFSREWPSDEPKPATAYTHITIGDKTETEVSILGLNGSSMTLQVHGWSWGYKDDEPVEQLVRLMDKALEEPLVLDGYGPVSLRNEMTAITSDPNPEVRHAPVRYRIFTLPIQP